MRNSGFSPRCSSGNRSRIFMALSWTNSRVPLTRTSFLPTSRHLVLIDSCQVPPGPPAGLLLFLLQILPSTYPRAPRIRFIQGGPSRHMCAVCPATQPMKQPFNPFGNSKLQPLSCPGSLPKIRRVSRPEYSPQEMQLKLNFAARIKTLTT